MTKPASDPFNLLEATVLPLIVAEIIPGNNLPLSSLIWTLLISVTRMFGASCNTSPLPEASSTGASVVLTPQEAITIDIAIAAYVR